MPKILKVVIAVIILVVLLIAGFFAYVVFGINPNDYKSQIEDAAQAQGIELEMQGDLSWTLFPYLGLNIGTTTLSSDQHKIGPSTLESVTLSLAWQPLLKKQVIINALMVDSADIQLSQLSQAAAIASVPSATDAQESPNEFNDDLQLAIHQLSLTNSKLTLINDDGSTTVFDNINLSTTALNASSEPAPIALAFEYPYKDRLLLISANGGLVYSPTEKTLDLNALTLGIENLLGEKLSVNLAGKVNLAGDTAELELSKAGMSALSVTGRISAKQLSGDIETKGQLELESQNLKEIIEALTGTTVVTKNPGVLKNFNVKTTFSQSKEAIVLEHLKLSLDTTNLNGDGNFRLSAPKNLRLNLKGDQINLDDYQSPEQASNDEQKELPVIDGDKTLLAPLAGIIKSLDGGKASITIAFDKILAAETALDKLQADIHINGNKVSLSPLKFEVYDGLINSTVAINLDNQPAAVTFNLSAANLDIAQAQQQWTENTNVKGRLSMDFQGSSRGESADDLKSQLNASGKLNVEDLHLSAVNIEQSYCELAQLVEKNPPREQPWPEGTDLDTLSSQFSMEGQTLRLHDYTTGIGNLKIHGKGNIKLDKETFDIDVIANLDGDRTSENGCAIKSKRIQNRDIPMECKDSFDDAGAGSCKPDSDFVEDILKKEVLDKFLKPSEDGEEKPLEGLLRGLLNR